MSFSEDSLRSVFTEYEEANVSLWPDETNSCGSFHANGWRPVDLQRITGYSRETILARLNPDVTGQHQRRPDGGTPGSPSIARSLYPRRRS